MTGLRMLAALAAMTVPHAASSGEIAPAETALTADSAVIAAALDGQTLQLSNRATTVDVSAAASPAENGCAALVVAQGAGSSRKFSRLLRWEDLAWVGAAGDGPVRMSFHHHEGRLATDSVTFRPTDAAAFRAALDRTVAACRRTRGVGARVMADSSPSARSCYFPQIPGLQLFDAAMPHAAGSQASPPPPRAVLSILARENPEAELQLVFDRTGAGGDAGAQDRGQADVLFTFADPQLRDMHIAQAAFALDAKPVAAHHSLAVYGDTRVRISVDPFKSQAAGKDTQSFYRRLSASGTVALTLLDNRQHARAVLHFDAGPALEAARRALAASDWSCAAASPAPPAAAQWHPVG